MGRERNALLTTFTLERALHELAHELTRKSDFVGAPLDSVAELLVSAETTPSA